MRKVQYILKNKSKRFIQLFLCAMFALLFFSAVSRAAEAEPSNLAGSLMTLQETALARENPDADAAAVTELPAGSAVMVTGETDGWYQIFFQGQTAYIEASAVSESSPVNVEALDQEFWDNAEKGESWVESLLAQQAGIRQSRIWGSVIIGLVVLIFGAGVFSALRQDDGKRKQRGRKKKKKKRMKAGKRTENQKN